MEDSRVSAGQPAQSASQHWSRGGLQPVTAQMAALLLGAAAGFNLVGNAAFHTIIARRSSVSSYGVTALFLAFGILAGVLGSGFQYAAARRVVHENTTQGRELWRIAPWLLGVIPITLAVAFIKPIGEFININEPGSIILAGVYIILTVAQAVPLGLLTGTRHFRTLTALVVFGVVVRLGLFPLLAGGAQTTSSALLTSDISTAVATCAAMVVVWRFRGIERSDPPEGAVTGAPAPPAEGPVGALLGVALWGTWILALVFSRHDLSADAAGIFSVGHTAAGAILFLAGPVTTAYIPAILRNPRSLRPVAAGLGLTAGVSAAGTLGLVALGPFVFAHLYGPKYLIPRPLFLALGVSASLVACATFLLWAARAQTMRHVVRQRTLYLIMPVAMAMEVVCGLLWNGSEIALAMGPGVAVVVGVLVGLVADAGSLSFSRVSSRIGVARRAQHAAPRRAR